MVLVPKCPRPFGVAVATLLDTIEIHHEIDTETVRKEGFTGSLLLDGKLILFIDLYPVIEQVEPDWYAASDAQVTSRVLLVEDSIFHASIIGNYLRGAGVQVTTASNGVEGLSRLEEASFDLVISDLEMPLMDGFEMARNIRQRSGELPLIAITSMQDSNLDSRIHHAGFEQLLYKSDQASLLRRLLNLCTDAAQDGAGSAP